MLNELQKEIQNLNADLNERQVAQLDKLLQFLADVLGQDSYNDLLENKDLKRLIICKSVVSGIYKLLSSKEFNFYHFSQESGIDIKEFWDWTVGEKKRDLLKPEYKGFEIKRDPKFSADGENFVVILNNQTVAVNGSPWDSLLKMENQDINYRDVLISEDGQVVVVRILGEEDANSSILVVNQKFWDNHLVLTWSGSDPKLNYDGSMVVDMSEYAGNKNLYVNDKLWSEKDFNFVGDANISENGKRIAILTKAKSDESESKDNNQKESVVFVDRKKWNHRFLDSSDVVFSPDSKKVAVCASEDKGWTVWVDDLRIWDEFIDCKWIDEPVWSPDSQKIAAIIHHGYNNDEIIVDKKIWPLREGEYSKPVWSPDSNKVAAGFKHSGEGDYFLVVDGIIDKSKKLRNSGAFKWSPDSQKIAICTPSRDKGSIKIDDDFWDLALSSGKLVGFSPDSQKFAVIKYYYEPNENDINQLTKIEIVINDKVIEGDYKKIVNFTFSPDSQKIMFVAKKEDGEWYRIVKDVSNIK